jgi:hypothetical protein
VRGEDPVDPLLLGGRPRKLIWSGSTRQDFEAARVASVCYADAIQHLPVDAFDRRRDPGKSRGMDCDRFETSALISMGPPVLPRSCADADNKTPSGGESARSGSGRYSPMLPTRAADRAADHPFGGIGLVALADQRYILVAMACRKMCAMSTELTGSQKRLTSPCESADSQAVGELCGLIWCAVAGVFRSHGARRRVP